MSIVTKAMMQGAAGTAASASASSELCVEDLFSTYLYEGTSKPRSINNGIALGNSGVGTSTEFDGISDYLSRSTDLIGNVDGKAFTFSAWIYPKEIGGWSIYSENFYFNVSGNENQLIFVCRNSSNNNIFYAEIPSGGPIPVGKWSHILISIDLTNTSNRHLYVNDVDKTSSVAWNTYINENIDFTQSAHTIGDRTTGGYLLNEKVAHVYLDYTYRNLSTESNRRYFIDANGGSTPSATLSALSPILYLPMTKDYPIGKNLGTGGDFTASGSPQIVESGTEYKDGYGHGGLVWLKWRSGTNSVPNQLWTTDLGAGNYLQSNNTVELNTGNNTQLNSFNSDGFSLGYSTEVNFNGDKYVSWAFRKAPKFFDIVTYTGDGTLNRQIPHNLNSNVGMVIVKAYDTTGSWLVNHRSNGQKNLLLNESYNLSGIDRWGTHTSDHITLAASNPTDYGNATGVKYVAYIFAHNNGDGEFGPTGDQDIIKCGSYTGNGSETNGTEVNLGFEPQWLLVKASSTTADWFLVDNMRDWGPPNTGQSLTLKPNASTAESSAYNTVEITPTGFKLHNNTDDWNGSGQTYIYMAIRRGPMRPPTSGSEVFAITDGGNGGFTSGFPVDTAITKNKDNTGPEWKQFDRMRGHANVLYNNNSNQESGNSSGSSFHSMDQFAYGLGADNIGYLFRRSPNFFDTLTYTGDGSYPTIRTIPHNLGVAPELIIYKCRSTAVEWETHFNIAGTDYLRAYLNTNLPAAGSGSSLPYGAYGAAPDAENIYIRDSGGNTVNGSGKTYIAFLFASLAGVSKVGSYIGNGTSLNIDCAFNTGARFVLIKRTDIGSDWYIWDTFRGIVTGNDSFLTLNTANAENSSYDSVDPYAAGFTVNQDGGANINVDNGNYIYLAIS